VVYQTDESDSNLVQSRIAIIDKNTTFPPTFQYRTRLVDLE
jgi:hypothetical protein